MARTLIYTSARKLLAAGRTGFGTVARSRKISALAAGAIERLSQFDRKRGSDTSRVIYAHRRTNVGNTSIHVLSAIRDAGADYTGRTNHIAHHLLIDPSEARNLAEKGITPADILANYEWLQSWNEAPRYYENEDDVDLLSLMSGRSGRAREQWKRLTGNAVHARLVASKQAPKSAVLVLPDAEAPLPLMAEALYELDGHSWDITFTTALEPSDSVGDFAWVITSPLALQSVQDRCISRTVLHADQPDQLPVPEERPVKKPTIATREPAAQGAAQGLRPNHREPDIAAKNQTAADRVYGSTPLSHPIGHAGTTRHQLSSQPAHRKQSVPLAAIIGASAALLMAMVIVVMLLSKDREGQTNLVADQKTEPAELTTEQKRLAEKIATTNAISRIQANEAVRKFNEKDCEWWEKYLENLKKVCVSENPWSRLEEWEMTKGDAPKSTGIPQWMEWLVNSGEKKVFNDLVELAKKFKGQPFPQEHWDDFDKIARSYTGKKPFNEGELSNPFPKMAEELLKRQIVKSFDPEEEKEVKDLIQIFELGIWQNSLYENIPHTVFWDLTRNAKLVSEWDNFVKKYKKVRRRVIGEDMKDYLALHKEYEKIEKEWSVNEGKDNIGVATKKKNEGYKKLFDWLQTKHDSKPTSLVEHLQSEIGGSLETAKKNDASPKNPQPKPAKENLVTRRFLVKHQDFKEGKFKTELLTKLAKDSSGSHSKWIITIDGEKVTIDKEKANLCNGALLKTKGTYIDDSGVKIAKNGTITLSGNAEVFKELVIQYGSKKEHIFIHGVKIEGDNDRPLWGEHSFDFKQERKNLVLTGDLRDRLNELDESYKKVEWRNNKEIDGKFKRSNDSWIWKSFFDVRVIEPLKLKIDEKQKDTPPRNELIRLRENCERICKRPLSSANLGSERDDLKKKQRDSVKALHGYIENRITRAELKKELLAYEKAGSHFDDLESRTKSSKLIGFTKYLEKRSDPNEAKSRKEKSAEDNKKKMKRMIEIKVYTPGGTNDKDRRLIFIGKRK